MPRYIPRPRIGRVMRGAIVEYSLKPNYMEVDPQLLVNRKMPSLQCKIKRAYKKHGGIKFQIALSICLGKYTIHDGRYHEIVVWFNSNMISILDITSLERNNEKMAKK